MNLFWFNPLSINSSEGFTFICTSSIEELASKWSHLKPTLEANHNILITIQSWNTCSSDSFASPHNTQDRSSHPILVANRVLRGSAPFASLHRTFLVFHPIYLPITSSKLGYFLDQIYPPDLLSRQISLKNFLTFLPTSPSHQFTWSCSFRDGNLLYSPDWVFIKKLL